MHRAKPRRRHGTWWCALWQWRHYRCAARVTRITGRHMHIGNRVRSGRWQVAHIIPVCQRTGGEEYREACAHMSRRPGIATEQQDRARRKLVARAATILFIAIAVAAWQYSHQRQPNVAYDRIRAWHPANDTGDPARFHSLVVRQSHSSSPRSCICLDSDSTTSLQ